MPKIVNKEEKIDYICDEAYKVFVDVGIDDFSLNKFITDLLHHFDMEEKVMFPTFEDVTGMTQGPTMIMRMEHDQMRQLLNALQEDLEKKDKNHFFGVSESLMMLMQQHNMKEEQMLYAMADVHLASLLPQVIENMKAI